MAIIYEENTRIFRLETANTTYAMAVTDDGYLGHLYYGARTGHLTSTAALRLGEAPSPATAEREKITFLSKFPFEYPTGGVGDYRESCLDVTSQDGEPGCELRYRGYRIEEGKPGLEGLPSSFAGDEKGQTLFLDLEDPVLGLAVTLQYSVFPDEDVITRSAVIRNESNAHLVLNKVLSASLDMDNRDFQMLGLFGALVRERHREWTPLHHGRQVISSTRGVSSHAENPFIALGTPGTDEDKGEVYAMNFVYSGSFLAEADLSMYNSVRLCMGIHPEGFRWNLRPGEHFTAPEVVMTWSGAGIGRMTRNLHHFYLDHLIRSPWKYRTRPVLLNNWEGTYFDFDHDKLLALAKEARACGVEMFVMDDGWFGARNSDNAGLGDWYVNEEKLQGGIARLSRDIHALGMKFGMWVEPEMVNMDSDLYRAHPDWVIQLRGRRPAFSRHQWVLDFSRREVRETVMNQILAVLHEAKVDYVKWDMNRYLCDLGSAGLDEASQGELLHRYVLGLYEMQEKLLAQFPDLLLENCSSGGGRFDPGMLYYSPQIWASDDTDAIERLRIQDGTAMIYPPTCMGAHVSKVPNEQLGRMTPLETRGNVAMMGTFGYELDLTKVPAEEKEVMKRQIAIYHEWHPVEESGDYYRLRSWSDEEPFDCWMFVSPDQKRATLTYVQVLGRPNTTGRTVFLKGLDPEARYHLTLISGRESGAEGPQGEMDFGDRYGDELMRVGLLMPGLRDYESRMIGLEEV